MIKSIAAVAAGLVTWFVAATLANFVVRAALPGYTEVEVAMNFTLGMQVARLAVGVLSSILAGFVTAWISAGKRRDVLILTALLLAVFLPVHYSLWARFPVWYHALFLVSLMVAPSAGAWMRSGSYRGLREERS